MTETLDHAVPLADTLDESHLRRVFPGAPADLAVPRDVGSLFAARMRSVGGARRAFWIAVFVVLVVGGGVLALGGAYVLGGVVAGAPILALAGVAFWQHGRASDDFFDRYAAARGLTHREDSRVAAAIPLFGRGDEREWSRVLAGTICDDPAAAIAHYTYTEVSHDSDGNRSETDYDFTTISFRLPDEVARRYRGVSLSPRSWGFGKLQDALQDDRKVELESAEFAKRYTLRAHDDQDDIALYELFSTTFVQQLATQLTVYWEQRGADLVVWCKGHETEAADLDRMCLEASHVLQRYREEWR